ncbi:hypothetical protein SAMN05444266_102564 [Chitinophaga jiangningensis]|uniref:Uncharacterized protein n=1 Tax=Chitinophaga jiangningensis TaxID=1419482 RepID=A0A1M6Z0S5_9BACT|nr:hypothetical protein [Chitinophaga jiangningensis]SHL23919.1 hypothetical protein SAMN05444266_102564 [Chitinophaga jiangningensis]
MTKHTNAKKQDTIQEKVQPNTADYQQANKNPMQKPETGLSRGPLKGKDQTDDELAAKANTTPKNGPKTGKQKNDVADEEDISAIDEMDPDLDEEDLEENNLSDEEADDIEWDDEDPEK